MTTRTILPMAILLAGFGFTAAAPAFAADQAAEPSAERFQIEKTKYGFVRLDRQTGAMTFCREDDEALTCDPAATTKPAVENQVIELKASVDALAARLNAAESAGKQATATIADQTKRLKANEDALAKAQADLKSALAMVANPPASLEVDKGLSQDGEFDSNLQRMEKMMNWFIGVTRKLDEQEGLPQ